MNERRIILKHFEFEVRHTTLRVKALTHKGMSLCNDFENTLKTYKSVYNWRRKSYHKEVDKVFTAGNKFFKEFIIFKTLINPFFIFLKSKGITSENANIKEFKSYRTARIDVTDKMHIENRDYQDKYHFELTKKDKPTTNLVDLQTGKGKTIIALQSIKTINKRTAIIVLGRYVDKWVSDIKKDIYYKKGDIEVIKGKNALIKLMKNSKDKKFNPKFIIFTNKTLLFYFKEYEALREGDKFNFPIRPDNLFRSLKVGVLLIDEVHQEYHSHYRAIVMLDPMYTIALSATLITRDNELNLRYNDIFPESSRLSLLDFHKYVTIIPYMYRLESLKGIKTEIYGNNYSHNEFEMSLVTKPNYLKDYLNLISDIVRVEYIDRRKGKEKMILFAYNTTFCEIIRNHLRRKFPQVDIRKYTSEDDYKNIIETEIGVTTMGSAGTAIDIPGLISVLQTVNIKSYQANLQAIGRLRFIKNREVRFTYLYCGNIPKHRDYHYDKLQLVKDRALKIIKKHHHKTIGGVTLN